MDQFVIACDFKSILGLPKYGVPERKRQGELTSRQVGYQPFGSAAIEFDCSIAKLDAASETEPQPTYKQSKQSIG